MKRSMKRNQISSTELKNLVKAEVKKALAFNGNNLSSKLTKLTQIHDLIINMDYEDFTKKFLKSEEFFDEVSLFFKSVIEYNEEARSRGEDARVNVKHAEFLEEFYGEDGEENFREAQEQGWDHLVAIGEKYNFDVYSTGRSNGWAVVDSNRGKLIENLEDYAAQFLSEFPYIEQPSIEDLEYLEANADFKDLYDSIEVTFKLIKCICEIEKARDTFKPSF